MNPGVQGGVALPDPAPVVGVGLDHEDAADGPVVGAPVLPPDVLQLLYALAVPQYPVAPASTWR